MTRAIGTTALLFTPSSSTSVRIAVYSSGGRLIGTMIARDPSKQRGILERKLSSLEIQDYSESIWSATLPYNWVDEGNVVLIGCVDPARPMKLLVHRIELRNLAQFSEHTITRTKLAAFGSASDIAHLDSSTHPARRLARNLYAVMPVAELKWVDTDLWHLPYVVVMGSDGPALVTSEEERRAATGDGEELSWNVLKNFLTIRHSLATTGHGLSLTNENGANSPYTSGTSVFMGWSLSKRKSEGNGWEWEDLGYWDTLAAAAWTGWCAMKAGDECSNYLVHEIGHAQTMQHFDEGTAEDWGIEDEYPLDGKHTSLHPWGYDSVARQFRTWFDPFQGDGKMDPLNGAGESPTSHQCYSQYTPFQAKKSQEWALRTPALLSSMSSSVPEDGAYVFDPEAHSYLHLDRSGLTEAVGEASLPPERVGIPVVTFVGTIGKNKEVCQTYPALRSSSGNTFELPDPLNPNLPPVFDGAAYFVEVRFHGGRSLRGLIAVKGDLSRKDLSFYSFNIALERRPESVGLYRFTEDSYPNLTPMSKNELLHLRPTELPPDNPLAGLTPLLRVGRGWLGDSSNVVVDSFCISAEDCGSDDFNVEWRSDIANNNVVYSSSLTPQAQGLLGATVFQVPAKRDWDDSEYSITVLATRVFNDGMGSMPLLVADPTSNDEGSLDIDATHGIRIVAPWEMNGSLPAGTYRSLPGAFKIFAQPLDPGDNRSLLWLDVLLELGTITESPTISPTRKPSPGPTKNPVQIRYYIDWGEFTCVTDGESTEWAPAYVTKDECCLAHMGYDFAMCMRNEQR